MATPWEVLVTWGGSRLAAEVLGEGARHELTLGNTREDDVQLGFNARLRFSQSPLGLQVELSTGVTGTLQQRGDEARKLSELVAKGVVREAGSRWSLTLGPGDVLELRVGTITVRARETKVLPSRLPIELAGPAVLLLAIAAIVSVMSSVVAPPPTVEHLVQAARAACGTGPDPACAMTRDGIYPLTASEYGALLTALRAADGPSKVAICERYLRWAYFTAAQLGPVLSQLDDEVERLRIAKLAAPRVVNPWNAIRFATAWRDAALSEEYAHLMRTQRVSPR